MNQALAEHGFARVPAVAAGRLERLRGAIDGLCTGRPGAHGHIVHDARRRSPELEAEIPALAAIARAALDCAELVLFQDHVIAKPPGTALEVRWHQDYAYWPLDAPAGLTLWVTCDDADDTSGCLRYLPGTHHLGERRASDFVAGAGQPGDAALPALEADDRAAEAIAAPALAGDALVHDPLVWHMSPPNRSPRWRRAWSLSFVRPEVRWAPRHCPHPFTASLGPRTGDPLDPARFPRF